MKAGYTGYTLHGCKKSHENIMAVANMADHWSTEGRDLILNKLRRKDKRPIAGIITWTVNFKLRKSIRLYLMSQQINLRIWFALFRPRKNQYLVLLRSQVFKWQMLFRSSDVELHL